MEEIVARTYKSLEWERLKSFLVAEANCHAGRSLCRDLPVALDKAQCQRLLDETQEVTDMIQARTALDAAGLPVLDETFERLSRGAALTAHDFIEVKTMLKLSQKMKSGISLLPQESFPRITAYDKRLHALPEAIKAIERIINDDGGITDDASPMLKQLRREVQKLQTSIHHELTKIIHSPSHSKALQEPIYTQRNGRHVLPVNAGMRNAIVGIVHDSSASGLTVYVEPMAVVELANNVRLKEAAIEREIARILDELARQMQTHCPLFSENYAVVAELDAISARARLGLKFKGSKPEIADEQLIDYKQARHPLLVLQTSMSEVVPNDINLGGKSGDSQTLVITGPNTGGKTVLLKTVGIFALMLRAGLLLPVAPGSVGCIFTQIFADIGDEQSLEQNLSTFSSHMQNIVQIVSGPVLPHSYSLMK